MVDALPTLCAGENFQPDVAGIPHSTTFCIDLNCIHSISPVMRISHGATLLSTATVVSGSSWNPFQWGRTSASADTGSPVAQITTVEPIEEGWLIDSEASSVVAESTHSPSRLDSDEQPGSLQADTLRPLTGTSVPDCIGPIHWVQAKAGVSPYVWQFGGSEGRVPYPYAIDLSAPPVMGLPMDSVEFVLASINKTGSSASPYEEGSDTRITRCENFALRFPSVRVIDIGQVAIVTLSPMQYIRNVSADLSECYSILKIAPRVRDPRGSERDLLTVGALPNIRLTLDVESRLIGLCTTGWSLTDPVPGSVVQVVTMAAAAPISKVVAVDLRTSSVDSHALRVSAHFAGHEYKSRHSLRLNTGVDTSTMAFAGRVSPRNLKYLPRVQHRGYIDVGMTPRTNQSSETLISQLRETVQLGRSFRVNITLNLQVGLDGHSVPKDDFAVGFGSDLAMSVGSFALIAKSGLRGADKAHLVIGEQSEAILSDELCLPDEPISWTRLSHKGPLMTWTITGSLNEEPIEWSMESARKYIGLPDDAFRRFLSDVKASGVPLQSGECTPDTCPVVTAGELGACDDATLKALPSLDVGLGESGLSVTIRPIDYVWKNRRGECVIHVALSPAGGYLGLPFLRKVVAVFDRVNRQMGFCRIGVVAI